MEITLKRKLSMSGARALDNCVRVKDEEKNKGDVRVGQQSVPRRLYTFDDSNVRLEPALVAYDVCRLRFGGVADEKL